MTSDIYLASSTARQPHDGSVVEQWRISKTNYVTQVTAMVGYYERTGISSIDRMDLPDELAVDLRPEQCVLELLLQEGWDESRRGGLTFLLRGKAHCESFLKAAQVADAPSLEGKLLTGYARNGIVYGVSVEGAENA